MGKPSKARKQGRSSVDGQFVTKKYAESHPKTTEIEHIPKPGYGIDKRKKSK